MSFRSYVKVARPAEHNSSFTKQRNITNYEDGGEGGPGVPGPEGPQGPAGPQGPPGKDGVVDPSKLNIVFNTDQIELVDADGNFCGLHVKGANGITVTEDEIYGNQSMVIGLPDGYETNDGLEARVNEGERVQAEILDEIQEGLLKQEQLINSVEELSITKGSVARYTVTQTNIGAAIRNGELYVSSPNAADVIAISFAPFDNNGQPTRPANAGDIIEFVEVGRDVGEVTRYRILDGGNAQALGVEYISGTNNFAAGDNEEVYIYPQNSEGASKEYVDAQDLALKGYVDHYVGETNDKLDEEVTGLKDYIDTEIENLPDNDPSGSYLPISGGTLTGPLKIQKEPLIFMKEDGVSKQFKISPNTGNYSTNLYSFNEGGMSFRVSSDNAEANYRNFLSSQYKDNTVGNTTHVVETQVNWLRTPIEDHHAANKWYVDDLDERLTAEINNITNRPDLLWMRVNKSAGELAIGEFYISSSNKCIYLHPKAIGNIDLNMESNVDKITGIKHMVSVHKISGTINYSIVCDEISFNNSSNKYIRLQSSQVLCDDYTSEEQICRLNIPGFTF